ncbi:MAG: tetratricopeptide repeat protein [Myxococcota bacterium]
MHALLNTAVRGRGTTLAAFLLAVGLLACSGEEGKLADHLSRGEAYLEEEQFAEAVLEFRSALQIDPNLAGAHYGLAKSFLGSRQVKKAYWELQETVRLDPTNLDAHLQYGQFLLLGEDAEREQAIESANVVIAADPERAAAWVLKGRALQALGRIEETREALAEAVRHSPDEGGPLLLLANLENQQENREAAEALYRQLPDVEPGFAALASLAAFLAQDPERDEETEAAYREALAAAKPEEVPSAHRAMFNFYYSRERFEEAEAALQAGIDAAPDESGLSYALARFYHVRGRTAEADAMIEAATQNAPDSVEPWLVLSSYRSRIGDPDGALAAADSALEVDSADVRARLRRAELLVDLGHRRKQPELLIEGRAIVAAVLAGDSERPEALFVQGKIDLAEGKVDAAENTLRRAVEGKPDWAQAHLLLGSALFLQRDLPGARSELVRALELEADLAEAEKLLARVYQATGDDLLAIETGRRSLRRGEDPKLRILIAQSLVREREFVAARNELEMIPAAERDAEAHFALGRIYVLEGDREGARTHFEAAEAASPGRYEVLKSLLDLDVREGRLEESVARITAAREASPEDARLARLQGEAALYGGDAATAEAQLQRAIELDPNDLKSYQSLARYLMVTGRPREVIETYESALEQNPDSPTLHLALGTLYEMQGQSDNAAERYESAIALDPGLAVAKNNLAYLLAAEGSDLDRALELAQEARELLPESPSAADTLGWVLFKKNIPGAAIGYLREAVTGMPHDDPQRGIVQQHLALAYEADEQFDSAREVVDEALADLDARLKLAADEGRQATEPPWAAELRSMRERLNEPAEG